MGISEHCILTLHDSQNNTCSHFITALWDKLSKILSPCPLFILHISHNFFSSLKLPLILLLSSLTKLYLSKFWLQPKEAHQVEIPLVKEIVYLLTFMKSDHVTCKVTLLLVGYCPSICINKSFLTNRTSSPGNKWGPAKQKGHRSRKDNSFASDITTKRTISLITDTIILLTFGILSQSMKTYECDNFHEILRGLHKLF